MVVVVVVKDRERIRTAAVLKRKQNEVIVRPEGIPVPRTNSNVDDAAVLGKIPKALQTSRTE